MPDLLHEFWRCETDGQFGRVDRAGDRMLAAASPELDFQFEIWAPSWREAMRLYEERAYGEFGKAYDHLPDTIYTAADVAEQQAYLKERGRVR